MPHLIRNGNRPKNKKGSKVEAYCLVFSYKTVLYNACFDY